MTHPVASLLMLSSFWRYKICQKQFDLFDEREGYKLWHLLNDTPYTSGIELLDNCTSADDARQGSTAFVCAVEQN